ncbi:hypothetical protein FBU30_009228 [Linnemannia zychae]|nr:hypothetical protein FBU30_009228 [Linnemannia zychae]
MVRQRSNSSSYRTSQEAPETPMTPRTPRSPHLHRSRLTSPLARSQVGRGGLKREFPDDEDLDMDLLDTPSRRAYSSKPTPTELLSVDLTSLALHNRTVNGSSSSQSVFATPSPSSRFKDDDDIERLNLTLPFEKIPQPNFGTSSSSSLSPFKNNHSNNNHYNPGSLESVHRYPTRTATSQYDLNQLSPFTTPVKANSNTSNSRPSPMSSSRSPLQSPPRSSPRQFMNDEDNNLFLTRSPRAIRTPRKPMSQLDNHSNINNQSPASKSTPSISTSSHGSLSTTEHLSSTSTTHLFSQLPPLPTGLMTPGASQTLPDILDDDMTDNESVQSSQGDHEKEKENVTPKMSEDPSNPFFVSSEPKRSMRYTKTDGSTTPTGCTTAPGTIRRSTRLALGSISPWRWNSFDEYGNLLYSSMGASGLKGKGTDWIEGKLSKSTMAASTAGSAGEAMSSLGSGSGTSYGNKNTVIGPSLNGKSSKQLPDNHPNAPDSGDRKGTPSRTAMRNAESVIEPQSVAFNRRAQQVAGRIFYWKNGSYQLVSESDKQQWPCEWKFEVYQDPESPGAIEDSHLAAAISNSLMTTGSSSTASYLGKGKLTDRQLSGPSSKRSRINGTNESTHQSVNSHTSESDLVGISLTATQDPLPPPSPTPASTINTPINNSPQASKLTGSRPGTPSKKARMQDRYDFRERRMLNRPLTPRSRRCGA